MTDTSTTVARFRKNQNETVLVRLADYHGVSCVDVRVFVEGGEGADVPTKKGVAIRTDLIPTLIVALQDAATEATRRIQAGEGGR